jgi:hypothetical protein
MVLPRFPESETQAAPAGRDRKVTDGLRPGSRVRVARCSLHPDYQPGETGTVVRMSRPPAHPPVYVCTMDRTGQEAPFFPEEIEPLPFG